MADIGLWIDYVSYFSCFLRVPSLLKLSLLVQMINYIFALQTLIVIFTGSLKPITLASPTMIKMKNSFFVNKY